MKHTQAAEIIDNFESTFADKRPIPETLELIWLKKAVSRFSVELKPLVFDEEILEFDTELSPYEIDILAEFMKQFYQERQVSLINKHMSVETKDISIDKYNGGKKAVKAELDYITNKTNDMINKQKALSQV